MVGDFNKEDLSVKDSWPLVMKVEPPSIMDMLWLFVPGIWIVGGAVMV